MLLQRGNGRSRFNALIELDLADFLSALDGRRRWPCCLCVRRADLGSWDGVPLASVKTGRLRVAAVTDADDARKPSLLLRGWIRKTG